jgi:putative PEP-CTERM system histidine kinase
MGANEAIYGLCAIAFLALITLMLLRGRTSGPGIGIVCACALTAAWAADLAFPGLLPGAAHAVLDSLRLSAWLILMVALIGMRERQHQGATSLPVLLAFGFCVVVVGYELGIVVVDTTASEAHRIDDALRAGLGVGGLLAAENLLRNADDARRRALWPLCLALGAIFAFELFLYADRLMVPGAGSVLAGGRALVGLFAVPLLALAMARNRDWRIDIHVSRTVVLHTTTLVASGVFFLALSGAGVLVRELGGSWGPPLQLLTLLGSAVVLAWVFGSRQIRIRLQQLVARHFFSNRFDYRMEWLRFVDTVSQPGDPLAVRVVKALAQIVDSPAGILWYRRAESGYVLEAGWNLTIEHGRQLSVDHPFVAGFRGGGWVQQLPIGSDGGWPFDLAQSWLAIPLAHGGAMIGFVALAAPPHSYVLDRECFDLLRAAGRQAASYLAEEESTRALIDSRLLNDYSKRFAFVVHDIKNLASQLGLVVANARRFIDNPAFRADMLQTLDDAAARMNRLIAQLHVAGRDDAPRQVIEPDIVIADLAQEMSGAGARIETQLQARDCAVAINPDELRSILSHLINNAREATKSAGAVVVSSRCTDNRITIDVIDSGPGMDGDFIRDELFRPFRSTKRGGLGIGAYQTQELLRLSGGQLDVISVKGGGTVMRVTLPMFAQPQLAPSVA